MVRLKNTSGRLLVYQLAHAEVCSDEQCCCTSRQHLQTVHNPQTGDVGIREVALLVPASVHLAPGEVSNELPDSVLGVKRVAADLAARRLVKEGV